MLAGITAVTLDHMTTYLPCVPLPGSLYPSLFSSFTLRSYAPFENGESPKVRLKHSKYLIIALVFKPEVPNTEKKTM